jgi:hypothetical protein
MHHTVTNKVRQEPQTKLSIFTDGARLGAPVRAASVATYLSHCTPKKPAGQSQLNSTKGEEGRKGTLRLHTIRMNNYATIRLFFSYVPVDIIATCTSICTKDPACLIADFSCQVLTEQPGSKSGRFITITLEFTIDFHTARPIEANVIASTTQLVFKFAPRTEETNRTVAMFEVYMRLIEQAIDAASKWLEDLPQRFESFDTCAFVETLKFTLGKTVFELFEAKLATRPKKPWKTLAATLGLVQTATTINTKPRTVRAIRATTTNRRTFVLTRSSCKIGSFGGSGGAVTIMLDITRGSCNRSLRRLDAFATIGAREFTAFNTSKFAISSKESLRAVAIGRDSVCTLFFFDKARQAASTTI